MRKRAYRGQSVQNVEREIVGARLKSAGGGTVGIDVSKSEFVVVLRYADGRNGSADGRHNETRAGNRLADELFERPWKVRSIRELPLLVEVLKELNAKSPLSIGLESTGTYGDPLRQALTDAGLDVRRVGNKASSDYAEVFDGVPSQHDGKDAAVIAELVAIGKSSPWPWQSPSAADEELQTWTDWYDIHQQQEHQWLGRLEALLARHWPESTAVLRLTGATLIRALAEHGGPERLLANPQAVQQLKKWSGSSLATEKIELFLSQARATTGVRMSEVARTQMQKYATEVLRMRREQDLAEKALKKLAANNPVLVAQGAAVGVVTACVLWVSLGNPAQYRSGAAYRKAMGLNLKERSSGRHCGQLKITKRGSSRVRRWLYFAALRASQQTDIGEWYEKKKSRDGGHGGKALVGIMRKLALALYQVGAHGAKYAPAKLFPGRPLSRTAQQEQRRTPLRELLAANGAASEQEPAASPAAALSTTVVRKGRSRC